MPERPPEAERPRLSLVSAIGPLVLGVVMVIVLHNMIFALFMLLSPVLVIGGWWEQRRHARRTARGHSREQTRELERFREELGRAPRDELARRRAALPDPAELMRRATAPDARLWERRPEHEDFMILMGGLGEAALPSAARPAAGAGRRGRGGAGRAAELPPAPVRVDLAGGGVVGIVGPATPALALARALVCQAATLHGPADLRIAMLTEAGGREDVGVRQVAAPRP